MGAEPHRISVRQPAEDEQFDGLIISGGDDIGPELYGAEPVPKVRPDRSRDALELHWIEVAGTRRWPLLGICRGAQLLNVADGGSLVQDITSIRQKTSNRPTVLPTKTVALDADSTLSTFISRQTLRVNSLHHQAVDRPGRSLRIIGKDEDTLCQAIEAADGSPILGVQWHPEYLPYLQSQRRIFRWLLSNAALR